MRGFPRPYTLTLGGSISPQRTLVLGGDTTITGGGTLALGGFTLTVPATLTAAGRNVTNTFTDLQTVDLGTGTLPAFGAGTAAVTLAGANDTQMQLKLCAWRTTDVTGYRINSIRSGGTRAAPSATPASTQMFGIAAIGHDGIDYQGTPAALMLMVAGSLWSATNRETAITYETTASGSTSRAETMRIQGSSVSIGGFAPTAGSGLLQLASGTTLANGMSMGDFGFFRSGTALARTNSAQLIGSSVGFTNGSAAAAGTLLNAPAAGNPTKWIPIDDNGTTRYLPAW